MEFNLNFYKEDLYGNPLFRFDCPIYNKCVIIDGIKKPLNKKNEIDFKKLWFNMRAYQKNLPNLEMVNLMDEFIMSEFENND